MLNLLKIVLVPFCLLLVVIYFIITSGFGSLWIGENLRGFEVKTGPFPGFPTDLQPQIMALLTTCNGVSPVEESVFEKRMGHGMWYILCVHSHVYYICRFSIA